MISLLERRLAYHRAADRASARRPRARIKMSLPLGSHMIVVTSRSGRMIVHKHTHLEEAQPRLVPLRILR